jgi:exodeoxyribonuclease VII small subunit
MPEGRNEGKFEESFKRLGKIVEKLEGGELSLDEALKQFEEGIRLAKGLNQKIEESRRKVEQLLKGKDGKPVRKAFLEGSDGDEEAKPSKRKRLAEPEGLEDPEEKEGQEDLF